HELRTPLTSITASLELLKRGIRTQSPATAGRLVEIAEHNCTALRRLVNDLLDAEKFESGKMEFDFQVVDLSRMLERTIESNKAYAASYGVEIVSDGIEPDVRIKADAPRIDQLMANLLSNAVKFSERDGKVEVNLRTDTGRAIVSVRDHGRGIPQKDRSRIFERFQQVDSSNERERGGTGLGLAIVKAIAKAHDAGLTVESELGKGSTFIVSFPLAE
ncbi:MAG: sensor histidine kinase, partial [Maritimibacter harenae]